MRLDQLQVLATHNSYHLEPTPEVADLIRSLAPDALAPSLYSHPPLAEQLDLGVRSFEIDVFTGGAGLEVLHSRGVDVGTTCARFVSCLEQLDAWSQDHPEHVPIVVQLEAKEPAALPEIEGEIRSVLDDERLVTPADVQGDHGSVRAAVEEDGWPVLDDVRGRFVFVLDDHADRREAYRALHPDARDRLLFVDARPPDDDAAYVILNDPIGNGLDITRLVEAGFMVRTRADADTIEAQRGDPTRADAAFASGAQVITTDFEVEDPRYPGFVVALPGGGPVRCNPVSAPPGCEDATLEG